MFRLWITMANILLGSLIPGQNVAGYFGDIWQYWDPQKGKQHRLCRLTGSIFSVRDLNKQTDRKTTNCYTLALRECPFPWDINFFRHVRYMRDICNIYVTYMWDTCEIYARFTWDISISIINCFQFHFPIDQGFWPSPIDFESQIP